MEIKSPKRRYILGFDGIRALAVIAVILYHFLPNIFSGGYLGVPIFFVVSGYLITDLLRQEFTVSNTISIRTFYLRRIKRLYPALVFMLLSTVAYITLFNRGALLNLRATIGTNLIYVYNLWEINHGQSYFQQFTAPSPFTHLWSLSVEGQFYLIWPLVVLLLGKLKISRKKIIIGLFSLAVISAVILGITFDPNSINRAYYGTDSRLFAILLGAALAYAWPSNELSHTLQPANQRVLNYLSFASLAALALGFGTLGGQSPITYYGGMFIFTIAAMILVATIAAPGTWLVKVFNWSVFNWLGTRSYGIYLYQYPVLVFFDQLKTKIPNYPFTFFVIEVSLIFLISELSYRFLEQPLRRIKWPMVQSFFRKLTQLQLSVVAKSLVTLGLVTVACFGLLAPEAATNYQTPLQKELAAREKESEAANAKILAEQKKVKEQPKSKTVAPAANSSSATSTTDNKNAATAYNFTDSQLKILQNSAITAIGDSMLVNIGPSLQKVMPVVTNGKVGRQPDTAPDLLTTIKHANQLADNVLIMLGTNGIVEPDTLAKVMQIVGPSRQVFWVSNYVQDRSWIPSNEALYKKALAQYPNFHLIDWNSAVKNQRNWLGPDNIHPNPLGDKYLTHLIGTQIANTVTTH